jgi:hypothetical protein
MSYVDLLREIRVDMLSYVDSAKYLRMILMVCIRGDMIMYTFQFARRGTFVKHLSRYTAYYIV